MKESSQSQSASSSGVGRSEMDPAVVSGDSLSLPSQDTSVHSRDVPKIKPYVRKRPRDSSDDVTNSILGGDEEVGRGDNLKQWTTEQLGTNMHLDSEAAVVEVKPYVRKRKKN